MGSLEDDLARWQAEARRPSSETRRSYAADIRRCLAWVAEDLGRPPERADLTPERLQRWVDHGAFKPATVLRRVMALRSFLRWTLRGTQARDPTEDLDLPAAPAGVPRPYSEVECERLMAAPLAGVVGTPAAWRLRDDAMIRMLYGGGPRSIEVSRLNVADLVVDDPPGHISIWVDGKGHKAGKVPLPVDVGKALQRYLGRRAELLQGEDCGALFLSLEHGERLGRVGVSKRVAEYRRALGMKKGAAHGLRHSCASHLLDNGAELRAVQQLLRHRDARTTAGYTEVGMRQMVRRAIEFHPLSRPGLDAVWRQVEALGRVSRRAIRGWVREGLAWLGAA